MPLARYVYIRLPPPRDDLTKRGRHIYYQNPPLFGNQAYVDRLIDDIAFTFGVGRDALNVVAASKGLIAGAQFDCDPESHRVAIPPARNVGDLDLRSVKWVLIIEKEAIFHGLAATRYYKKSAAGDGIIVTAKGYPDLATRQFLHSLHCMHPQLPIHALVDFDPDGIAIMRTFKHGSQALKHEADVLVPGLRWLGVRSSDVFDQYNTENADLEVANMSAGLTQREETRFARRYRSLSCLTAQDRIKGIRILNSLGDQGSHGAYEMEVARELQFMLMLNLKFEIQAVNGDTTLMVWLDKCLLISHAGGPGGR
ncbi:meiotic recombination protein spo11 [Xylariales sp. PMI_506]|nr:meiotic recombination protein spo11 [Xylariales sp. PMI_506]